MRAWEGEFAEFAVAVGPVLRRQAYARCRDWALAEQLVRRTLLRLYRRWPSLGYEPPEAFAQRTLLRALRRFGEGEPPEGPEPPSGLASAELLDSGRRLRRRERWLSAATTVLVAAGIGYGIVLLRPDPGGGPLPEVVGCMDVAPPETPLPSLTRQAPAQPPQAGERGVSRLATLVGDLPLPQDEPVPADKDRREKFACLMADLVTTRLNPMGLRRLDLGLADGGDKRPLAALPDPELAPDALTVSLQLVGVSGYGTLTVSVAPTTMMPGLSHCQRLTWCGFSSTTEGDGLIEQYGLRDDPPDRRAGFNLGTDAQLWTVLLFTGHTLIMVTITNTPDVNAAQASSQRNPPLGMLITNFAMEERLAIFDPPEPSPEPTVAVSATGRALVDGEH
ncbi:hypothetical protein QEZ54_27015 [Catellatospora sp. KI3]|uniref:hypothetical protein n=1 Tax=Catellatospora sp. KI3 TaxID=3041620 RepID=UPI002482D35D|nr:hypothetical protein [Catellatospora sp. KI3]MDI1464626.1 hypothetical protein [Catellatospora sp. KI3]